MRAHSYDIKNAPLRMRTNARGRCQLAENNKHFNNKIKEVSSESIELKQLTDFEWDKAYTFRAYLSKEEISDIIGIDSKVLFDTMVDEGLTNIIFVKDNAITCKIIGRTEELGYSINFGQYDDDYISFSAKESCNFSVKKDKEIYMLEYIK